MRERSRRTLLGSGAALVTGLLGASVFGRSAGQSAGAGPAGSSETNGRSQALSPDRLSIVELRWYGQNWQLQGDGPRVT